MAGKCLKFKEVYKPSLGKKVKVCQQFGDADDFAGLADFAGDIRDCKLFRKYTTKKGKVGLKCAKQWAHGMTKEKSKEIRKSKASGKQKRWRAVFAAAAVTCSDENPLKGLSGSKRHEALKEKGACMRNEISRLKVGSFKPDEKYDGFGYTRSRKSRKR